MRKNPPPKTLKSITHHRQQQQQHIAYFETLINKKHPYFSLSLSTQESSDSLFTCAN